MDIVIDEINTKIKFYVLPYEATDYEKKILLKNRTSKPQNGLSFNQIWEKISLKFYHQGARISTGLKTAKMAYENPSPLVVEFQT